MGHKDEVLEAAIAIPTTAPVYRIEDDATTFTASDLNPVTLMSINFENIGLVHVICEMWVYKSGAQAAEYFKEYWLGRKDNSSSISVKATGQVENYGNAGGSVGFVEDDPNTELDITYTPNQKVTYYVYTKVTVVEVDTSIT